MAALIPVVPTRLAGADLTTLSAASAAGDTFPPSPDNFLRVKSTNTATVTVTVMATSDTSGPSGSFLAPLALAPVVQATTGERLYGPFPSSFASNTDGQVHITYSSTTNVNVQVLNFSAA